MGHFHADFPDTRGAALVELTNCLLFQEFQAIFSHGLRPTLAPRLGRHQESYTRLRGPRHARRERLPVSRNAPPRLLSCTPVPRKRTVADAQAPRRSSGSASVLFCRPMSFHPTSSLSVVLALKRVTVSRLTSSTSGFTKAALIRPGRRTGWNTLAGRQ